MNPHERLARMNKVNAVCRYVDAMADGLPPQLVLEQVLLLLDDEGWEDLAKRAKQNPLSATSREWVLAEYRERAALRRVG